MKKHISLLFIAIMFSCHGNPAIQTFHFNRFPKDPEPLWNQLKDFNPTVEKRFVIIVPSFNNKDWYKFNLDSIFSQKYTNFRVIYIDDASPDGTAQCIENYLQQKKQDPKNLLVTDNKFVLLKNKTRRLAVANIYAAIQFCEKDEIVMILDGDDWFEHDHVLTLLNKVYSKYDVWLTYGQYKTYPVEVLGINKEIPEFVFNYNAFREYNWTTSQLRTFYAWLFKKINVNDLMYENDFASTSYDQAIMYPMLEMAGRRVKCIPDIIYIYNRANVLNDDKANWVLQRHLEFYFRTKTKYTALSTAG